LTRTPVRNGRSPERIAAWAGSVRGTGVIAFSKTTAFRAKASIEGVAPPGDPYAPT
jgi:hypothetical protein